MDMERLRQKLAAVIQAMQYEFVDCEWLEEEGERVFRVYITCSQGITVDDCAKVSRQIGAMFDVEPPLRGHYVLQVSSPGTRS